MLDKILKRLYRGYLKCRWHIGSAVSLLLEDFYNDYKKYPFFTAFKIHGYGFSVDNWKIFGLNSKNYRFYLSDVQYYGLHPLNGAFTVWIDDKLTLKYILAGTPLENYMPKYYFQIDEYGNFLPLMDCGIKNSRASVNDVINLLELEGELAVKLRHGSLGEGFYKVEYRDNKTYYMNGNSMSKDCLIKKIKALRNYIITEYLHPHRDLARFCPNTVNCIRYLLGRIDGKMTPVSRFVRFGTTNSGYVENYNAGGVLCYINAKGQFSNGNILDREKSCNKKIYKHPDNNEILFGEIPLWNEIIKIGNLFNDHFPQLDYLGIDLVVSDKDKVHILEINSLTSLDTLQINGSILDIAEGKFFLEKISKG